MALRQEFKKGIEAANRHFGTEPESRTLLHKIIAGPPLSGKSTLARDYARELLAEGFLKKPPVEIDCARSYSDAQLQFFFNEAQDGMIVVKNPQATTRQETLLSRLNRAIEKDEAVVVLVGPDEAINAFLAANQELSTRFNLDKQPPVFVLTDKSYSPQEQAFFEAAQGDAWHKREKERKSQLIVSEWREMKEFDISVGHDTVAPERASFAKKPAKVT